MELNPPKGAPSYQAFTLFGPSLEAGASAGEPVLVVLHGFLSAIPNGTYKRLYRRFSDSHRVIGVNYDPLDVEATWRFLRQDVAPRLAGRQVTVLGTSLGGWWALRLARWVNAERIVLLNPVLEPEAQLSRYIGVERLNPRRDVHYRTTGEAIAPYGRVELAVPERVATLLLLCRDDDRVDYRKAAGVLGPLPGTEMVIYDSGGHTIALKRHPALERIAEFLARAYP